MPLIFVGFRHVKYGLLLLLPARKSKQNKKQVKKIKRIQLFHLFSKP